MTYKVLALDLDGTTLAPDTSMTETTKNGINRALEAGVTVVFCTGRCKDELHELVANFPKMRYAVCENGVVFFSIKTHSKISFYAHFKNFFKIAGAVLLQNKKHIHLTDIICP